MKGLRSPHFCVSITVEVGFDRDKTQDKTQDKKASYPQTRRWIILDKTKVLDQADGIEVRDKETSSRISRGLNVSRKGLY